MKGLKNGTLKNYPRANSVRRQRYEEAKFCKQLSRIIVRTARALL